MALPWARLARPDSMRFMVNILFSLIMGARNCGRAARESASLFCGRLSDFEGCCHGHLPLGDILILCTRGMAELSSRRSYLTGSEMESQDNGVAGGTCRCLRLQQTAALHGELLSEAATGPALARRTCAIGTSQSLIKVLKPLLTHPDRDTRRFPSKLPLPAGASPLFQTTGASEVRCRRTAAGT